jgi:hypothetical protein
MVQIFNTTAMSFSLCRHVLSAPVNYSMHDSQGNQATGQQQLTSECADVHGTGGIDNQAITNVTEDKGVPCTAEHLLRCCVTHGTCP